MKKILSILLTISILFSCINFNVFAEMSGALSVSAPTSAVPGETINVTVSVPSGTNALSGSFNLIYDNTMLEVVSCTNGTNLSDRNVTVNEAYSDTKIRMSFDGDEPLSKGGIILNATFNVLPGASGTVKFEVEKFRLYDENYEAIEISETVSDLMHIVNDADTEVSVSCAENVNTGENLTVTVGISNALNVCGGSFNLVYDADKFTLISATAGNVLSSFSRQLNKTYATNKIRLTWAGSSAMTENGTLLTVIFTAKDGVLGNSDFTLEKLSVSDVNGTAIESIAKSGSINVVCTHNVMEWTVTEAPTCTETGTESYVCGCGHLTDAREVPATGHVEMEWIITTEATCDNTGVKEYTCKSCGYVEKTEEIPAHGHVYESVITPPSQAEQGYTTHTCTGCGHSYKDAYTDATGYTVSYDLNGGENTIASQTKMQGESIVLSDIIPTRTGYTFLGWATDKDAENAQYYAGNTYSADADLSLYAIWDAHEHTITYIVDGETVSVQTYDYEALINALAEPSKEGYTFSGWDEIPVTMPDEDIIVSGSFSINSYIVNFDANGGENAPDELTDVYNSTITIPESIPTKEGFTFVGWATSNKAKKAEYNVGDSITLTKDVNLYAVWVGIWSGNASEKFSGGNGTKTNPYIIKTAEELKLIADKVNSGDTEYASACYIMVNDIALNDVSNVDNWATEAPTNEWIPIGNLTYPFTGTFDGNGYTISGLYINQYQANETGYHKGLFGFVSGGTVSNIGLEKGYLKAYRYSGALVGGTYGATVKNCYNKIPIIGDVNVAGIVGAVNTQETEFTIENCYNEGTIAVGSYSGGVLGSCIATNPIQIKSCYNVGKVTGGEQYVGGLVGYLENNSYLSVADCYNLGAISAKLKLAGVVGCINSSTDKQGIITNCYNGGNVSSNSPEYTFINVGGVVGHCINSQITKCYNYGSVSSPGKDDGAVCAFAETNSIISECYNVADIKSSGTFGGVVGVISLNVTVKNCFNTGTIETTGSSAGVVGWMQENCTVLNCINIGNIIGNDGYEYAIARNAGGVVNDCYYLDTCGAAGEGIALSYTQMQNCANYAYIGSTSSWKNEWIMGCNPYGVYPSLKNMTNLMEIPIEFDLNGGHFDEYVFCASVVASKINSRRGVDYLVIFNNSNAGTGTNIHGCEVIVDSRNIVVDIKERVGNNVVPNGGFILSGHGMMHEWLQKHIELGDKVYYDANTLEVKVYKKNPKFTFAYGRITYLPTPHKDGYVFSGWQDENGRIITYSKEINNISTLKLTATWAKPEATAEISCGNSKYMRFDVGTCYESAKKYCESIGGHLATITSEEENDVVIGITSSGSMSGYIIGGSDTTTEGTFEWDTGETFSYTDWNANEPNNSSGIEDAIEVKHIWNDISATNLFNRGFVCEFDAYAPVGAMIHNGHYYQLFDNSVSWEYAKAYCESKGGHLITITSADEQSAITSLISKFNTNTNITYWLGATDADEEGNWKWVTGEEWNYTNWNTNQPDDAGGKEHYIHIYTNSNTLGKWNDLPITYFTVGFICEYDEITPVAETEYNGHKYLLFDTATDWTNAQAYCESIGGYLTTITSEDEQKQIKKLISSGNKNQYWLGATDKESESTWKWITAETWNYSNWASNQPDNYNTTEHYLQIFRTDHPNENGDQAYGWNDAPENNVVDPKTFFGLHNVGFICEIGTVDSYIPVISEINPANGHIYSVYDIKTTWSDAKQFCENIGGHLVTINDANENDYVVSLARDRGTLPAYYIGASDAKSEGVWKWVTGEQFWSGNASGSAVNSSYTNWLSGEPNNSGSVEHCAHISSTYSWQWNDTADTSSMGIICEFETAYTPVSETVYNGHKYYLYDTPMTWTDAKIYAESIGAYLSVITSQEEQDTVYNMISSDGNKEKYYLGASNLEDIENWKWVNGEDFSYFNWGDGMPHNLGLENENFLMMYKSNGDWNDLRNYFDGTGNSDRGFIVEFDDLNTCKITYDANGGENAPETVEYQKNTDITISSKTPTRPGYMFKGWAESADGEVKYRSLQTIRISESLTLYAVWEEKNYTITFDANGGINVPRSQTKPYRIAANISEEMPVRAGYTFVGWSTNDSVSEIIEYFVVDGFSYKDFIEYVPGQEIYDDSDLNLYAVWVDNEIAPNTITYYHDGKIYYIQAYNEYARILGDVAWLGWSTYENAGDIEYYTDSDYFGNDDLVLYSVGEITGVYMPEIYFDSNGGENGPYFQGHNLGEPFILTNEIPTREDYIFVGWATSDDATKPEYLPGEEYTYDEELYLFAIWKPEISGACGEGALWNVVKGVLTITGEGNIYDYEIGSAPWYEYRAGITDIVINDGITAIGDYAFYNLCALKSVDTSDSLTSIGEYAFSNCTSLSSVDTSNVTSIGNYAFRYCFTLSDIEISSATTYGVNVYANCSGVKTVNISDGISEIKANLLDNCGTIDVLNIPGSVTKINENAFADCSFTSVVYSGTKDEFTKLLTSKNVLNFDTVTCEADNKTYLYSDFFAETVNITGISLEKKSIGLSVGERAQIVATVTPSNTTEKLVWSSDNETVATVDGTGNITAISEGVANITVTSESGAVQTSCVVYINNVIDENAPVIVVGNIEETKNGDTFDVDISLKNNPGITSMRLALTYDTSVMELTNVTDSGLLGEALHSEDYSGDEYVLYWDNGISKTNFTENGKIATLTYNVKDNAKSGNYPLTISYGSQDIINSDILPVGFDVVNGFVTVKAFTYGDVNSDESVDTMDSAYLSRHIARWSGITINSDAADVNKDKKTNVLDSAILKRHIANWPDYGTLPYYSPAKLFSTTNKAEELSPIISVSDAKGQSGKTVDVTISIKDNPGIVNMRLDVDYDKEALVLAKVTDLGLLPGEVHSNVLTDMPYCLYWDNGASKTDYTANGDLVKLTFEVKENAAYGNYPITVSYKYDEPDIINASLEPVKVDINNGTIEIVDVIKPQIALSNVEIGEKTNFTLQLLSPNAISGMVFVATYDKGTSKLCTLEKYDAMAQKDFSINTENGEIVKIMWWDSFENLKPIADSVIVSEE